MGTEQYMGNEQACQFIEDQWSFLKSSGICDIRKKQQTAADRKDSNKNKNSDAFIDWLHIFQQMSAFLKISQVSQRQKWKKVQKKKYPKVIWETNITF